MLGISLEGRTERADFAQVDQGKRSAGTLVIIHAVLIETVADGFAERGSVDSGIRGGRFADRLIVPPGAGLDFLGTDHVFCVRGKHIGVFKGAHQAGVIADEVEAARQCVLRIVERIVDRPQGETLAVKIVIKADTRNAAAAVVPEDQTVVGGRIRCKTPAEESFQRLGIAHAGLGLPVDDCAGPAGDFKAVQLVRRSVVLPGARAAGFNDKTHAGVCGRVDHFLHVYTGVAVLAFQVRPADIHKDRPAVIVSEGRSAKRHAQHKRDKNCNEFFQSKFLLRFFSVVNLYAVYALACTAI